MKKMMVVAGIFMLLVSVVGTPRVSAQEMTADQAKVIELTGDAMMMKAGTQEWTPITLGSVLTEGDAIKTLEGTKATLELTGSAKTAEVLVHENTEMKFETFQNTSDSKLDKTLLGVDKGGILVKAEKLIGDSKFEVKTPTSIVGIRGTTFEVQVSD